MLRARVAVWAGPRGGYARIAVLPILRGLLPNPPMLPKRDTDCAGVASRREGVADRRHATPGGAFSSRICSVDGDTEECVNSPQSLLGATRRCCAGHASIDPKLNAPASPPPMVPKKCAIQSRTQWIEEIVARLFHTMTITTKLRITQNIFFPVRILLSRFTSPAGSSFAAGGGRALAARL